MTTAGMRMDGAPVDGARRRDTSRVVVLDRDDAALLFLTYGKDHAVPPRWITPGGGVDPGEDFVAAGERELREETGLVAHLAPPFEVVDGPVEQKWHPYDVGAWAWFAVRTDRFEPSDDGWLPDEHVDIVGARWFTADELERAAEEWEPPDLPARIRRATGLV